MAQRSEIVSFLDSELEISKYQDGSDNGLQFEGKEEVARVAYAVDGGLSVIESALAKGADFLLLHHGILWSRSIRITGPKKKLYTAILNADLNVYAAHLPLDGNPKYGNNHTLARLIGLEQVEGACIENGAAIGCKGINRGKTVSEMEAVLKSLPGAGTVKSLAFGPATPRRVCIVSGAGADILRNFETEQFDTLITGEPRQFAYHFAKEHKLNVLFGGHYATETVGVREAACALEREFKVEAIFVNEPTGI